MKIIHITSINTQISNGVRFSVPGLVEAQNKQKDTEAILLNVTPKLASREEMDRYDFRYIEYEKGFEEYFEHEKFDLAVFHSFYHVEFLKIYSLLKSKKIPYIIVPRGIFTLRARKRKFIKKRIADLLLFDKLIKDSEAIHFLTEEEKDSSRYLNKRSFIIPNGMKHNDNCRLRQKAKTFVFLGRLDSYTKGLDLLIEGINVIKEKLVENEIEIHLYGSDFPVGSKQSLINNIENCNLGKIIKLHDPVYSEEKNRVLNNADVFISPSRFEGMPMSILEALSQGLPCIISYETNLSNEITEYNCGWVVKLDARDISNKILDAILDSDLGIKSQNASRLIKEKFDWNSIAEKLCEEYLKVLDLR